MTAESPNCGAGSEYTLGVINADPSIRFVMGAPFELKTDWLEGMNTWFSTNRSDGEFIFDVINFHHYSIEEVDVGQGPQVNINGAWLTPEFDELKTRLEDIKDFAENDLGLTGKEFWLSEFGYDTDQNDLIGPDFTEPLATNVGVEKLQAQWTTRAFLEIISAGFDRAMVHDLRDGVSENQSATWDGKTGLLLRDGSPKKAWFYVYTMKNVLKNYIFVESAPLNGCTGYETGEDGAPGCPRILKFQHETTGKIAWAIWSPTADEIEYNIDIPLDCSDCGTLVSAIVMADASTNGVIKDFTVNSDNVASVTVSETPLFLFEEELNAPLCPNVTEIDKTCTSVTLAIDIPNNNNYNSLQVWYGVAADIDANGLNFDAFGGNATQFDHDLDLMTPTITVSGLEAETGYYFYVLPQTDTGLPLTEFGEPLYCEFSTATDNADAEDICKIEITPQMIIFDSNTAPTSIEGQLFDQQNFFDFCSGFPLPVDNPITGELDPDFIPWVDFNNPNFEGVELILDLEKYYHINNFFALDRNGAGLFQINYGHTADGPWFPLHTYFTNGFNEWVNFSPDKQPVEGVRYLQFINDDNNARLTELFICGEESCFINTNAVNESHCLDYDPQLTGWSIGCHSHTFWVKNQPDDPPYKTIQFWYSEVGPFQPGEHPQATDPQAGTYITTLNVSSSPLLPYTLVTLSGLGNAGQYYIAYRMLDNEGRSTPMYIYDRPIPMQDCRKKFRFFEDMGPFFNQPCQAGGVWWSMETKDLGGTFEIIETAEKTTDPIAAALVRDRIENTHNETYYYHLANKENEKNKYVYVRWVSKDGFEDEWIAIDLQHPDCAEGRSSEGVGYLTFADVFTHGLQLYPNPTEDALYLEFADNRYASYQIIDLMGRLRTEGIVEKEVEKMKLDVSELQGGVYILQMEGEGIRAKAFRFVVSE